MLETPADVVVVGAGVAGAALTAVLARDGRRVVAIERDLSEPNRIVGELLQPGGCLALQQLGLEASLEGIDSQRVFGYGMFLYDKTICVDYVAPLARPVEWDLSKDSSDKDLVERTAGRSFHNGRFVRRLREIAQAESNGLLIEGNVLRLLHEKEGDENSQVIGVVYTDKEHPGKEKMIRASLTIACDGCASRLRQKVNPASFHTVSSHFVGLLLRQCDLPFPQHGHVVLADPAPVLFYPISSTETRCLVDIPGERRTRGSGASEQSMTEYMRETIAPQLPEALRIPFLSALEKGEFKTMPNRIMPARPISLRGALLLGDSFNMRHPLTGGGMTVALSDVVLLRKILDKVPDLSDDRAVVERLRRFYEDRKPLSSTINILANALYAVMCATDDPALKEMRSACFDYLGSGGRRTSDPIRMLGGLKPSPYLLATHFFAVAVYGCGRALMPVPTPARVRKAWTLFCAAFNIVKPLVDAEGATFLSYIPMSRIPSGTGDVLMAVLVVAFAFIVFYFVKGCSFM